MIIRPEQLDVFEAKARYDFFLTAISDWFAIYRRVYAKAPKTSYEDAWDVSQYVLQKLEDVYWNPHTDCAYAVLHVVLSAWENEIPKLTIGEGLDFFVAAMPAEEAALELLAWGLNGNAPPDTERRHE